MNIKRKRIRKIDPYVGLIPAGDDVIVGVARPNLDRLAQIGFSVNPENGEMILPAPVGTISMFNAEGKERVHKDRPMETAYRTVEWRWLQWHGRDKIERSEWRDVPYQRYPRTFVAPPAVELTLSTDIEGNMIVRTPTVHDWKNNKSELVHSINLLLELFGECSFYDSSMKQLISAPIKRLNWRVLPPGQRTFADLKKELIPVIKSLKEGKQPFAEYRLETINGYMPNFAAVGEGGFSGYVVFGFPEWNLYILESVLYGNATYVFGERWEELSKKTKAEILNESLQHARFVHHRYWENDVAKLMKALQG